MKTGLFGQQLTLMEQLKADTYAAHARLQTAPFFQALAACQLPLESYVGQLRALSVIHGVLEQALDTCADERVSAVWQSDMRKLPRLLQDLRYFEPRAVADLKEAVEAALKTAERIRLKSLEQPLALLGYLYVLEGSTLGAVTLRPLYARAFLLTREDGLSYLHGAVPDGWRQFQTRMNSLQTSAEERELIVQSADGFLAEIEAVFRALFPFTPESRTYLITSINPEAGRHPVPADAREVQASLKAGDICWNRFPYFEQRYGERGRRFARSDAAWLVTLCQYEPDQISKQVRWLSRVLAGRGMPSLLLQEQLEILDAELSAVVPAKKTDYAKLSQAAAELRESRRKHLNDVQVDCLSEKFDYDVGVEWSARLPRTGELLACAVANELDGSDMAVTSLRPWLTDPARFPAQWIAAVESTLAKTRELVSNAALNPRLFVF